MLVTYSKNRTKIYFEESLTPRGGGGEPLVGRVLRYTSMAKLLGLYLDLGLWTLKKIEVRFLLLKKTVEKTETRFLLLK